MMVYPLVMFDVAIENLAIGIVSFPTNSMVIFHSYVNVYQRVQIWNWPNWWNILKYCSFRNSSWNWFCWFWPSFFFVSSDSKGSCVLWATMGTSQSWGLSKKGMLSKLLMLDFSNPFQMILIHTPLHSLHQYHQFSPEAIWGPGPNSREKSWLEQCPGETPKWAWPGPFWGIKHDNVARVPGQGPENSEGPHGQMVGIHHLLLAHLL